MKNLIEPLVTVSKAMILGQSKSFILAIILAVFFVVPVKAQNRINGFDMSN